MDFDRLPNEIFKKILQLLPFKDRVRITRVNRRFKERSEMVISQTKSMCPTAPIFRQAKSKSMTKIFRLTADRLEELICEFPESSQYRLQWIMWKRLDLFLRFPHPRLKVLKLDTVDIVNCKMIPRLLASLPNLRRLEWKGYEYKMQKLVEPIFYQTTKLPKLEYVKFSNCNFGEITMLVSGCWWNLKHVVLENISHPSYFESDESRTKRALNCLFWKLKAIEALEMRKISFYVDVTEIALLWNLKSLRSLDFSWHDHMEWQSDEIIQKISASFTQLRYLNIKVSPGIETLAPLENLKHLRHLVIKWRQSYFWNADAQVLQLTAMDELEIVQFIGASLSSSVVTEFVHGCPRLQRLEISDIGGIDRSPPKTTAFVMSLRGFVQENLTIHLRREEAFLWQFVEVRSALAEINQEANGRRIMIETGGNDSEDDSDDEPDITPSSGENEWDRDPQSQVRTHRSSYAWKINAARVRMWNAFH